MTTIGKTEFRQEKGSAGPKKGYKGLGMEGSLARWYAKNTKNRGDFPESADRIAGQTAEDARVLEVAPGPGYLAIELARRGRQVVGLDISRSFVEIARRNAEEAGVSVTFEHGNASRMPFDADSFDFIVCQAAFKNFTEPVQAINEMYRVLRPGGKAMILDLRRDAAPEAINAEVEKMGLGWLNTRITKLTFKAMLLKRAYSQEQFEQMVAQTPFKTCEIQAEGIGLAVSLVK